jgi:hypothetical protein
MYLSRMAGTFHTFMGLQTTIAFAPFAVATFATQGCASVKEGYGPDGPRAFGVALHRARMGQVPFCAGEVCGAAGYDIIDRIAENTAFAESAVKKSAFESLVVKTSDQCWFHAKRSVKQIVSVQPYDSPAVLFSRQTMQVACAV